MIREIHLETPHRGHLEILKDFSLAELEKNGGKGKRGHRIDSFKSFHAALEQIFNTDLLNKNFYAELSNWYFWALPQVDFPNDLEKDDEKRRATGLIRLLTRLIFCWFLKEKNLIPEKLFTGTQEDALAHFADIPFLNDGLFENLLASYNEETKTTARKQTGSFYTPRPIVDYMVDESLKAHLERKLTTERTENTEIGKGKKSSPSDPSSSVLSVLSVVKNSSPSVVRSKLDHLFTYTEESHRFTPAEVATLIAAIDALKILDPACGSGAFPMGVLHKLVYILTKLDPDNDRWKNTQLAKLDSAPMREELERAFADNNDDYGRKLYLIENCLYGVDIQPIAIQITKLRFFISLVCDQKTNR